MPLVAGSSASASITSLLKSSLLLIASTNCVLASMSSRTAASVSRVQASSESPKPSPPNTWLPIPIPASAKKSATARRSRSSSDSVPSNMKPLAREDPRVVPVAVDRLDEVDELRRLDVGNELEVLEDQARHPDAELRAVARDAGRPGLGRPQRPEVLPEAGERLEPVEQRLDPVPGVPARERDARRPLGEPAVQVGAEDRAALGGEERGVEPAVVGRRVRLG